MATGGAGAVLPESDLHNLISSLERCRGLHPRHDLTLFIELGDKQVHVLLHSQQKGMQPVKFANGTSSMALQMALIKSREQALFIYGNSVPRYHARAKEDANILKDFVHWNLDPMLPSPNRQWNYSISDTRSVQLTVELLFGLFYKNLKESVEWAANLEIPITQVVFCVSTWITSLERSRLRLAAYAAGFKNSLIINQPTLFTLFHVRRLSQKTTRQLLVLSENGNTLNLFRYSYSESGQNLKMIEGTDEHVIAADCDSSLENRICQLTLVFNQLKVLLAGKTKMLPKNLEVVLFCKNIDWKQALEQMLGNYSVVVYYNSLQAVTLAERPGQTVSFSKLDNLKMSDVILDVYRISPGENAGTLLNYKEMENGLVYKTTVDHPTEVIDIFQENGIDKIRFPVGTLQVSSMVAADCKLEACFKTDKEGVVQFGFAMITGTAEGCNALDYKWRPYVTGGRLEVEKVEREVDRLFGESREFEGVLGRRVDKAGILGSQVMQVIGDEGVLSSHLIKRRYVRRLKRWVANVLKRVNGTPLLDLGVEEVEAWVETLKTLMRIRMGMETENVDRTLTEIINGVAK